MSRPTLRPATEPLLKATPPGYQHLGTLPAADGGSIDIAIVCPTVEPSSTPKSDAVYAGFTREDLEKAFDRVKPRPHWKNPIRRTLPRLSDDERKVISAAIAFYTGSVADFVHTPGGKTQVRADGYYATIGA